MSFSHERNPKAIGFVYKATTPLGIYYGQKKYLSKKTLKPLKGQKRKRIIYTESDWRNYRSSNEYVKENGTLTMIEECMSKNDMNMLETYLILKAYYNGDTVLNKWCEHKLQIKGNKEC